MTTKSVSKRVLYALVCSTLVQTSAICAFAQTSETATVSAIPLGPEAPIDSPQLAAWDATATVNLSGPQLEKAFDLGFRLMRDKELYKALNDSFTSNVLRINARGNGLSLSQVVYVLAELPEVWKAIEAGLDPANSQKITAAQLTELLKPVQADPLVKARLASHNDPTRPLRVENVKGGSGYESMTMYVNHPRRSEPGNPRSKLVPAQDLRKLAIDFVKGAKKEVMFNVFEFDLAPLADAMIEANVRGVKIHGGVDAASYNAKTEIKSVVDSMNARKAQGLEVSLVVSVGLNHQKMIVRDPGTPNAAVLFLSGNFTQSCIGPEGDAVHLPKAKRPAISVPNANHAVVVRGQIPAAIVKQELRKTLVYGIKGASYPAGGAYQVMGPKPKDPKKPRSWMMLTFSPNGGLGDINRDVLTRVIRETRGPVYALHFAFSSEMLKNEIIQRIAREADRKRNAGRPATNLFFGLGDTPFAMQFWSVYLGLSGLQRDQVTKVYSPVAVDPLASKLSAKELSDLHAHIRIAPRLYGEKHVKVDGANVKITSKIHHKVFIFPESEVSVVGTSFNPSASAESNQEQVLIVRDAGITKIARGMFDYLYENSPASVAEEAERRNRIPVENGSGAEDGVENASEEAAAALAG